MVVPTNVNPRFFRSLLIASLSSVRAGTVSFHEFCSGLPLNLIQEKAPHLDAISDASVAAAAAFGADFIISNSVSFHVHPDELPAYCANLVRMTSKPGSVLMFNAKLSETPTRYSMRGWARPLKDFKEWLKPLTFVGAPIRNAVQDDRAKDVPIDTAVLEFRRD